MNTGENNASWVFVAWVEVKNTTKHGQHHWKYQAKQRLQRQCDFVEEIPALAISRSHDCLRRGVQHTGNRSLKNSVGAEVYGT